MPKSTVVQSSFTSGVLGAQMRDRTDTEEYYNGARDLLNVDPRPGGGFTLRPGLRYYGRLRNNIAAIDMTPATITGGDQLAAPPGSTPSPPSPPPPPPDPPPYPELPPWKLEFDWSRLTL